MMPEVGLQFDSYYEIATENGNPSCFELNCLHSLIKKYRPQILFEFGTFKGQTTKLLREWSKGVVYTLDLLHGYKASLPSDNYDEQYKYNTKILDKSFQIFYDSVLFDPSQYNLLNCIDFIFIDGSHSFEYCLNDSLKAYTMIKNKGVIVWHDYILPNWPGVMNALNSLYEYSKAFRNMQHIQDTSLVYCEVEKC